MSSTYQHPRKLLFISPHFPFPPTEGGMIRTCSLIKALSPDWEIHYLSLRNSQSLSLGSSKPWLSNEIADLAFEGLDFQAGTTFVERIGENRRLQHFMALRNKLKTTTGLRPVFFLANLPFDLYYGLQRHWRIRQFVLKKLRSVKFDAVLFDYTKLAHHAALIGRRNTIKIVNTHNVESDVARQTMVEHDRPLIKAGHWIRWKVYEMYERFFLPKCDILLASSQDDAETYRRFAPNINVVVIPNAVDMDALQPLALPEEQRSLIFPGRMDYPPNFHAVHFFCREILPRIAEKFPAVRLYVVGKNPPVDIQELASDRVVVTGFVEEVLPYWKKASALIVPLSIGGGTRIKILEAMALGRPVISTSKGCEGLEVTREKHLLIADDPEGFAECVIRVLSNPEQYFEMTRAARKLVEEKYSFDALGIILRRTLEDPGSEP